MVIIVINSFLFNVINDFKWQKRILIKDYFNKILLKFKDL